MMTTALIFICHRGCCLPLRPHGPAPGANRHSHRIVFRHPISSRRHPGQCPSPVFYRNFTGGVSHRGHLQGIGSGVPNVHKL